jgi:hypothetical protein
MAPPYYDRVKGIARKLATTQSQCLRVITGAYRATPVRFLEAETATPPLDLYLNKWVADFEQRLERTGKGELIQAVCNRVATRLQHRRQRHRRVAAESLPRPSLEFGQAEQRGHKYGPRTLLPRRFCGSTGNGAGHGTLASCIVARTLPQLHNLYFHMMP